MLKTVTVLALLLAPLAGANATPIEAIPADLKVPFSPTPVNAEGHRHIVYELHITNFGQTQLTLERLEVLDAASGKLLEGYDSQNLAGILARPGATGLADKRVIGPGLGAVAFIDVMTPISSHSPTALLHRLTFKPFTPESASVEQSVVEGGRVRIQGTPIIIAPPLRSGAWLASHSLSNDSSHRRTLITLNGKTQIAQRFAIDWTRIGADGQIFRGNPAVNANWSPYGAEVLAVADGRVSDFADGIPENDPTSDKKAVPISFDNAAGNHIILDLGQGRFALYAHLQPHSIRVRLGQHVKRGDVLALLGNSGKADAPHLHLQIMDTNSPLAAEGLPFEFDSFSLLGHVSSLKVFVDGTGWRANEPPSHRRLEMPLENAVVRFP
ncbi:MAG TPA: M23 family metallopeptidase [Rhizomicrobium sp.]|nr:M23 family metallopeptidase [Rhizomicrobium sp.]